MRLAIYWDYYQHYHCARSGMAKKYIRTQKGELCSASLAQSGGDSHIPDDGGWGRDYDVLVDAKINEPGNDRFVATKLLTWLEQQNPDVVFIPGYVGCVATGAVAWCRRKRKGAVLMFETQAKDRHRPWWKEQYKKYIVRRYDAGFAGGSEHRNYLLALGMNPSRIATGYDAVDNAFFAERAVMARKQENALRGRLNLPDRYFLAVGRMIEKKGFCFLIRSYLAYVNAQGDAGLPVWRLIIIGDGPERESILNEAKRLPPSARIMLPGYLNTAGTAEYLALASAFIMPSIREEQWGLVINEAMAAGVPVLASDICGATKDLVIDGKTGLSFSAGDENKLANQMKWYAEHPAVLTEMGSAARLHVNQFGLENFAENMLGIAEIAARHAAQR